MVELQVGGAAGGGSAVVTGDNSPNRNGGSGRGSGGVVYLKGPRRRAPGHWLWWVLCAILWAVALSGVLSCRSAEAQDPPPPAPVAAPAPAPAELQDLAQAIALVRQLEATEHHDDGSSGTELGLTGLLTAVGTVVAGRVLSRFGYDLLGGAPPAPAPQPAPGQSDPERLARIETKLDTLSAEVALMRPDKHEIPGIKIRLDDVERRVERLEDQPARAA